MPLFNQAFIFVLNIVPISAGDLFCALTGPLLLALLRNDWQLAAYEANITVRERPSHTTKDGICPMRDGTR